MCPGRVPRMHSAPVKNEEAFIPIAFHITSTLIITMGLWGLGFFSYKEA